MKEFMSISLQKYALLAVVHKIQNTKDNLDFDTRIKESMFPIKR